MAFFGFKDLSSLSSVDMTIYRYVSQNPDKVVYMRVRDIAQNAHVSNSSVMRFIHKIGFNSFPEFKAYLSHNDLLSKPKVSEMTYFDASNFPKDISLRLELVANAIYQSDNVVTLGIGESAFMAEYAARRMAFLGYNANAITDPFYPLESKLKNAVNTIIICFSVSGETTELIEQVNKFVNNDEVTLVCVSSNEASTIAKMSRYVLSFSEERHYLANYYDLSSQIPVMYIIESLDHVLEKMVTD